VGLLTMGTPRQREKRTPRPLNARVFSVSIWRDGCSLRGVSQWQRNGDPSSLSASMSGWKCPACQTQIRHNGDMPERNRVYRCHVCRLELVLDGSTQTMTVAPLPTTLNRRKTDLEP